MNGSKREEISLIHGRLFRRCRMAFWGICLHDEVYAFATARCCGCVKLFLDTKVMDVEHVLLEAAIKSAGHGWDVSAERAKIC